MLGNLQRAAGDLPVAIAAYRRAIKLDPAKTADARYGLALSLAETSDLSAAVRELHETMRQDNNSEFRLLRAVMMARQPQGAIAALRRAREQAHDDRRITETIDRAINQFESLQNSGVRIPRIVRVSDYANFPTLCYWRHFFTASAAIWSTSVAADRYNAACSAALAGFGKGIDPPPDEHARAKFRMQALDWLESDLAGWSKLLADKRRESRETVQSTMRHWRKDADLAVIRDSEHLSKLPEPERTEWKKLWAKVDELLKKADQP